MKILSFIKQCVSKSLLVAGLLYGSMQAADLRQQWQSFLIAVEKEVKVADTSFQADVATFKGMLADLNAVQSLSLWRATEFYQDMRTRPIDTLSAQEQQALAHRLVEQYALTYTAKVRAFMQQLITYKNAITRINTQRGTGFTSISAAQNLWRQARTDVINPLTSSNFITSFHASPDIVKLVACEVMKSSIDMIDTTIKTLKTSQDISLNNKINEFKNMLGDFHTVFQTWITKIMPEHAIKYNTTAMFNSSNGWSSGWTLSRYCTQMHTLYNSIMPASDNSSMFQRSASFCVNAAMLGSATAFERHYPKTAEDMFMLIHQNSIVAVAGTYTSIFGQRPLDECIDLPVIVSDAIAYFEGSQCASILKAGQAGQPQRIGIHYGADTIEIMYNMSLNNHSSTFQIIYDQRTQQCSLAVQFLGEARGRWELVAFLGAISKDLSGLELVGDVIFDRNAGIAAATWILKQGDFKMIADYLAAMADLSFSSYITDNMLQILHRSNASFDDTMQQAVNHYENRYGRTSPWSPSTVTVWNGVPQNAFVNNQAPGAVFAVTYGVVLGLLTLQACEAVAQVLF